MVAGACGASVNAAGGRAVMGSAVPLTSDSAEQLMDSFSLRLLTRARVLGLREVLSPYLDAL